MYRAQPERIGRLKQPWKGKINPFKIIDGVYFVGTYQASSHLLDTGDGLILFDTGYENTTYLVLNSIHQLGFDVKDIKYIVNTHWHGDHTEGTAPIADLSGAKAVIGRKDAEKAKQYFDPDIIVKDGDSITLGNVTVRFMETPGHTEGTISFLFEKEHDGKKYLVGSFGGAGANTLRKDTVEFDGAREMYLDSIARLKKCDVDVFLGNHCWNNDTERRYQEMVKTGKNTFIDKTAWTEFLDYCEDRVLKILQAEKNL